MEEKNENRGFMHSDYGDKKVDKSKELNESMSIAQASPDEYTNKINNIGGTTNA